MNVELLERVKAHILKEPRRLDMGHWINSADELPRHRIPPCGTVGCIAGWTLMLTAPKEIVKKTLRAGGMETKVDVLGQGGFIGEQAAKLLDIEYYHQAQPLFFVRFWPADLREKISKLKPNTKRYAAVVAKRIDRFIASEERA